MTIEGARVELARLDAQIVRASPGMVRILEQQRQGILAWLRRQHRPVTLIDDRMLPEGFDE